MNAEFPDAVPEISVNNLDAALEYYGNRLGADLLDDAVESSSFEQP